MMGRRGIDQGDGLLALLSKRPGRVIDERDGTLWLISKKNEDHYSSSLVRRTIDEEINQIRITWLEYRIENSLIILE